LLEAVFGGKMSSLSELLEVVFCFNVPQDDTKNTIAMIHILYIVLDLSFL